MSQNLHKRIISVSQKLQDSDMDRLSNLPDSILCLILSKLETIEAVKTSLISTRYKSLWMNITSLKFQYNEFGRDDRLGHFVNRVLIFLKSKSINGFCLTVGTPCNLYDIPTWVSAAIYMNVKVLRLVIHGRKELDNGISMPSCLYTSKTLEVLDIFNEDCRNLYLDVPKFVSLPKLTTLHLKYVNYSSDESVRRLISGCSSLENLVIIRNEDDGVATFTIDSPTLKILQYYFLYSSLLPTDVSIEKNLEFVLDAPELREFRLFDRKSRMFSVFNLCSLEFARLRVNSSEKDGIDSHYEKVVQILQEVQSVSHLWISGDTLEALSHTSSLKTFSRRATSVMETKNSEQILLDDLLDGSNNIYLSKDSSDTTHVMEWREPQKLPVSLLSCLKTISVSGFGRREGELTMIAYILKNAKMLKKITISEKYEFREKILKFDQGSEKCEIIFS